MKRPFALLVLAGTAAIATPALADGWSIPSIPGGPSINIDINKAVNKAANGQNPTQPDKGTDCGSVATFQASHSWKDLPGCIDGEDRDHPTSAASILARSKEQMKNFFEKWDSGDISESSLGSYINGCNSYENGYAEWKTDPMLIAAKPCYEEMKHRADQLYAWADKINDVAQNYARVMNFMDDLHGSDPDKKKQAQGLVKDFADDLAKSVAEANKAKIEAEVPIIIGGHSTTFGAIKVAINGILQEASAAQAAKAKEEAARIAPFVNALSGDKQAIFKQWFLGADPRDIEAHGSGGRLLKTPQDFASAGAWYYYVHIEDRIQPWYKVEGYRFNGSAKSSTYVHEDVGSEPPASAYP